MASKIMKAAVTGMAALAVGLTLAATTPASAFGPRHHFHGHRGPGVGAAIGLGIGAAALGAVAASAAANSQYNGYPVYRDGTHPGYSYDYYPDHGGYYGPY